MIQLRFTVNKLYLLLHTVSATHGRGKRPSKEWAILEHSLWKRYKNTPAYYLLYPTHIHWALQETLLGTTPNKRRIEERFKNLASEFRAITEYVFKSREFKKLYQESTQRKQFVERQWKKNEKLVIETIQKLAGLSKKTTNIDVYITHPALPNGRYLGNKRIGWGGREKWKNYSTVYLAHEIMHILTEKHASAVMHAFIELLCDNELRILLNKKGKYFEKGIGHTELLELEKAIFPHWQQYKAGRENSAEKRDIIQFAKHLERTNRIIKKSRAWRGRC